MSAPDVMRLLLNASAALSNVRYVIEHRDEFGDERAAKGAETNLWMALTSLDQLRELIGDDRGAAMIAAELTLCHAHSTNDDRETCRLEREHDGEHVTGLQLFQQERRARWQAGTIYDFERDEAEAFLGAAASVN